MLELLLMGLGSVGSYNLGKEILGLGAKDILRNVFSGSA